MSYLQKASMGATANRTSSIQQGNDRQTEDANAELTRSILDLHGEDIAQVKQGNILK